MEDRLKIATMVAAGLFDGLPIAGDDAKDLENPAVIAEAKLLCRAVARISLIMADSLLEEARDIQNRVQET